MKSKCSIHFFGSGISSNINLGDIDFEEATTKAVSYRENYLIDQFKNTGYQINWVSSGYRRNGYFKNLFYKFDDYKLTIIGQFTKNSFIRKLSMIYFSLYYLIKSIKKNDIVIVYNTPIIYIFPILILKYINKFNLVINLEDTFNKHDYRFYINYIFEYISIFFSNGIIASSLGMKDKILLNFPHKPIVINSGYQVQSDHDARIKDCPIKIVYSGGLYVERGVLDLIDIIVKLNNYKYQLIIIGFGPLSETVEEAAANHENIKFLGELEENQLFEVIASSNICVNAQKKFINLNFPSKITFYLSFGKYVLSTKMKSLENSQFSSLIHFYDTHEEFKEKILKYESDVLSNDIYVYEKNIRKSYTKISKSMNQNLISFIKNL